MNGVAQSEGLLMQRNDFPATKFICDVARYQMGNLTKQAIRDRWAKGEYPGVNAEWAAWNMK
jgi:hypothetical protein